MHSVSVLTALTPDAAKRLLRAAASLKLVQALPGERYALDDLGASLLGNPSVSDFIEHHALLYADLRDPVALLRGETATQLAKFWPYAGDSPGTARLAGVESQTAETYASYSALMSRSQALIVEDILDAYSFSGRKTLLDVGGGEGTFLAAVATRAPWLTLQLFDLPPVVERAKAKLSKLDLAARISTYGGSFLTDALPTGADVISFLRILHDHDDESALAALRAAFAALAPGGLALIAEPMAGVSGAERATDAYFGFYLLAMGRGRARTPTELTKLLRLAGFSDIRLLPTRRPLMTGLIIGRRM